MRLVIKIIFGLAIDSTYSRGAGGFLFNSERRQLRKRSEKFAAGYIAPHVMDGTKSPHFPIEIMPKLAKWVSRSAPSFSPNNLAAPDSATANSVIAIGRISRVDGSLRHHRRRAQFALLESHLLKFGTGSAKTEISRPSSAGKNHRRMVDSRTRSRLRLPAALAPPALRNGDAYISTLKNFHHQRPLRRPGVAMAVTGQIQKTRMASAASFWKSMPALVPEKKKKNSASRASDTFRNHLTDCRVPPPISSAQKVKV